MSQKRILVIHSENQLDNPSLELLKNLDFCVIDLETTGGNPLNDQIIEIGLVKIKKLKIAETQEFLLNPKIQIPDFIQKLTSIKQEDVEGCPEIQEVIDEITTFIGDSILVAHNTSFDIPFLNGVLKRLKKEPLPNKVICTNVMTKYLIPEILNSNLNYMCQLFGISHHRAHRAIEDAQATAKLLLRYLRIFEQKKIRKINQLYYPRNKFELDRVHFYHHESHDEMIEKIQECKSPLVITYKGEQGVLLATLPLPSGKPYAEKVREINQILPWKLVTIRMISPFLEGLNILNGHILKIPEANRPFLLQTLREIFQVQERHFQGETLQKIDFLIGAHLVSEQIVCYNFLNFQLGITPLFKFPGHKKKFLQYIRNQTNRFGKTKKKRKKLPVHPDLLPIYDACLENYCLQEEQYLAISVEEIMKSEKEVLSQVDKFIKKNRNPYHFPNDHL